MEATQIITESIDKTKVPPLHQKRVLAFINHFILSSCSFLNEFASQCEEKFIVLERKMQKVEAALTILEAKLASIPDVENENKTNLGATQDHVSDVAAEVKKDIPAAESSIKVDASTDSNTASETTLTDEVTSDNVGVKACDDDRYKKFFKMVHFGVPPTAVKIKMQSEGLLPDILDTPNLILADGVTS